jgi:hypothetical protein
MSLTPKTNIPSLYQEARTGLTPRANYQIVYAVEGDKFQGRDAVNVPGNVVRRIEQTVNNHANKGVNS